MGHGKHFKRRINYIGVKKKKERTAEQGGLNDLGLVFLVAVVF